MVVLIVERLVNDSDSRPLVEGYSDHACDVVKMPLSESFGPVQGINPNDHVILVELVREFIEVPVSCSRLLAKHHLLFPQVFFVSKLMVFVVLKQQFLRDMLLVNLVWLNVRLLDIVVLIFIILLAYSEITWLFGYQ